VSLPARAPAPASAATEKLVCFSIAGQDFGAPIATVKETLPERPVTRLFLVPPFVAGLINLRGEVVAVIDLARLLGLGEHRLGDGTGAIVILRPTDPRAAGRAAAGLLVERLLGVADVAPASVQPVPPTLASEPASYLRGVCAVGAPPRPLLLLDPARVLDSERLRPFRRQRP
jgi:purine-binding chemotaxis protein CheW